MVKLEDMADQFLDKRNGKYPDHRLLHSKVCENHILQWFSCHFIKKKSFFFKTQSSLIVQDGQNFLGSSGWISTHGSLMVKCLSNNARFLTGVLNNRNVLPCRCTLQKIKHQE